MKYPVANIATDIVIFLHEGAANAKPTTVPSTGKYTVKGVEKVKGTQRQTLYCEET